MTKLLTLHQPGGASSPLRTGTAFVQRSVPSGFWEAVLVEISTLVDEAEHKLFHKILIDTNHVLFQLLPDQRGELRKRPQASNTAYFTS